VFSLAVSASAGATSAHHGPGEFWGTRAVGPWALRSGLVTERESKGWLVKSRNAKSSAELVEEGAPISRGAC